MAMNLICNSIPEGWDPGSETAFIKWLVRIQDYHKNKFNDNQKKQR